MGIQYFYEARTSAEDKHERNMENGTFVATLHTGFNHDDEEYELGEDAQVPNTTFNEEGLEALQAASVPWCEELHGRHAIEQARFAKIFLGETLSWNISPIAKAVMSATSDNLQQLLHWQGQMDADVNAQNSSSDPAQTQPQNDWGSVSELTLPTGAGATVTVDTGAEAALPAIDPSQLKPDQF